MHLNPSESKGHDSRARGVRGWRELCSEKRLGSRDDKLLLFRDFAPNLGGFLEQRGAWVSNEKPAHSKKGREAQYLNQLSLAPQGRGFASCPESAENWRGRESLAFPGRVNFPQSPSNVGALSGRLKSGAGSWNGAGLNFRSGATRGDFQPV